jgi:hypothetical protein
MGSGGGGTPGGTSGQIQYNNAGAFGGFTLSGDATINTGTGAITFATVNSNVGSFTYASITVNAKGLITAASSGTAPPSAANPTATASDVAVNGSASTFMRSDAAPAVQKGSSSVFGVVKVDNTSIVSTGGIISATGVAAPGLPATIADLLFWYESDELLATAGKFVSGLRNRVSWLGQGASAFPISASTTGATVSASTLNSLPVISFPGSSAGRYANIAPFSSALSTGATIFAIVNPTSIAAVGTIVGGAANCLQLRIETSGKLGLNKENVAGIGQSTGTLSTATWYQNKRYLFAVFWSLRFSYCSVRVRQRNQYSDYQWRK